MIEKIKNIALIVLTLIIICLWMFHGCGKPIRPEIHDKTQIKTDTKKDNELKDSVRIKDSVRVRWVDKYKKDRSNPMGFPCDTFLKVIIADCDTVILKDTLEIIALKKVVKQDSVLVADYQEQHSQDSTAYGKLERKLKWQKVKTKGAFLLGVLGGGAAGVSLPRR